MKLLPQPAATVVRWKGSFSQAEIHCDDAITMPLCSASTDKQQGQVIEALQEVVS